MKTKRLLSVFLLVVLLLSLCVTPRAAALEDPNIQAGAVLLMDANTGKMVYGKK